jgi:hypothetical protein
LMDPQDVGRPDGPGQTRSDSWDLDPDKLIRPRSADSIKACGRYAAPIGRTHDRKRLLLLITPKVLADRGPSTHGVMASQKIPLTGTSPCEFRRVGWQKHQAEVFRHDEGAGGMPAGLVDQHDAMRPGGDGLREFGEKSVDRRGVEPGQHQGDAGIARGADRADDPGRQVAEITPPARGVAALPPDIAGAPLLPDPGLVLAPDLKPLGLGVRRGNLIQARSKAPF